MPKRFAYQHKTAPVEKRLHDRQTDRQVAIASFSVDDGFLFNPNIHLMGHS